MRNQDDSRRPTGLLVGVFPLSIIQSNSPVTTNGVPSSTDWGVRTNRLIRVGDVAYITGNPEPPAWTARLRGLPSWQTNSWSGELRSERTQRGTRDDRSYALTNLVGDAQLDLRAFMTNEIVGGSLTLTTQVMTAQLRTTLPIRGKNPLDATARSFIDAHVDAEFREYAWMIARHESRQRQRVYNQFNARGQTAEQPNWGTPYGWGMCQIDRGAIGSTTAVVYNWQTNIVEMNKTLRDKRERYLQIIDCYRLAYQNDPSTRWYEPDGVSTNVGGHLVSARQWAIITLYNGAAGTRPIPFAGWERLSTPIHFDPVSTNWILYTNSNNYVPRLLNEIEWGDVE